MKSKNTYRKISKSDLIRLIDVVYPPDKSEKKSHTPGGASNVKRAFLLLAVPKKGRVSSLRLPVHEVEAAVGRNPSPQISNTRERRSTNELVEDESNRGKSTQKASGTLSQNIREIRRDISKRLTKMGGFRNLSWPYIFGGFKLEAHR